MRRIKVVCIVLGIVLSGLLVSPEATPINSVPENAKLTDSIVINTAPNPLGNSPSRTKFVNNGAFLYPCIGMIPNIAKQPIAINKTIVITLILEKRNSASAKKRTEKAFNKNMNTMKRTLHIHTGVTGNQLFIIKPAAVNSDPSATVQVSQYSQAIVKPVPGPIYFVVYVWKDPVTGISTDNSPRQSITK